MNEKKGLGGAHYGRALQDQSLHFKTPEKVIWEYVVNSLEYINVKVAEVKVIVDNKNKKIIIKDNGRGLSRQELDQNFFMLHGENKDRVEGKITRGQYGTGKAACFGIANDLTLTSVKNKILNKVSLKLDEALKTRDHFPTIDIRKDEKVNEADGTILEISEIFYKHKLNEKKIIEKIERELSSENKFSNHKVWVNYHECQAREIQYREETNHPPHTNELKERFGDSSIKVKVAYEDLEKDFRGIKVTVNGFVRAISSAGMENKECMEKLFGEVELPDIEKSKTPAVKSDRSLTLDLDSDDGKLIDEWIGYALEMERKKLLKIKKEMQAQENSKILEEIGNKLANILNQHMKEQAEDIKKAVAANPGDLDNITKQGAGKGGLVDLVLGGEIPVVETDDNSSGRGDGNGGNGEMDNDKNKGLRKSSEGSKKGREIERTRKQKPKGGFEIKFVHNGESAYRSKYQVEGRIININLDHPQMEKSRNKDSRPDKDINFLRIAYEAAIQEYSAAVTQEKANALLMEDDVADAVSEIIQITDSLSRRIIQLYEI